MFGSKKLWWLVLAVKICNFAGAGNKTISN
jgi:hypothetical protein